MCKMFHIFEVSYFLFFHPYRFNSMKEFMASQRCGFNIRRFTFNTVTSSTMDQVTPSIMF